MRAIAIFYSVTEAGTSLVFQSFMAAALAQAQAAGLRGEVPVGAVVVHQGQIVETAATATLFANPQAAYTRELLSAIPLPDPDQIWL